MAQHSMISSAELQVGEILPGRLFISDLSTASSATIWKQHGFRAALSVGTSGVNLPFYGPPSPPLLLKSSQTSQGRSDLECFISDEKCTALNLKRHRVWHGGRHLILDLTDDHRADLMRVLLDALRFLWQQCHECDECRNQFGPTLVHCVYGQSRSAAICVAFLMFMEKIKQIMLFQGAEGDGECKETNEARNSSHNDRLMETCLERVRHEWPRACPNPNFLRQLQLLEILLHRVNTKGRITTETKDQTNCEQITIIIEQVLWEIDVDAQGASLSLSFNNPRWPSIEEKLHRWRMLDAWWNAYQKGGGSGQANAFPLRLVSKNVWLDIKTKSQGDSGTKLVLLRCKRCRHFIGSNRDILHVDKQHGRVTDTTQYSNPQVIPVLLQEWMVQQIHQGHRWELQGRWRCPFCKTKVGSWNWNSWPRLRYLHQDECVDSVAVSSFLLNQAAVDLVALAL